MARPIRETPVLYGKNATRFEKSMKEVKPMSKARREQIRKESESFRNKVTIKF